jgi:hypothetical protein
MMRPYAAPSLVSWSWQIWNLPISLSYHVR